MFVLELETILIMNANFVKAIVLKFLSRNNQQLSQKDDYKKAGKSSQTKGVFEILGEKSQTFACSSINTKKIMIMRNSHVILFSIIKCKIVENVCKLFLHNELLSFDIATTKTMFLKTHFFTN